MCFIIPFPLNNLLCNKIPIFITHEQKFCKQDAILKMLQCLRHSFFYFQFLYLEHLQTSSDIGVLIFQTEFFPLTNVLYTFYEYSMFNGITFSFKK